MSDLIRDAPLGQFIRLISGNRVLKYPEEKEGFTLPWLETLSNDKITPSTTADDSNPSASTSDSTVEKVADDKDLESGRSSNRDNPVFQEISATHPELTRTKSRAETLPYSEDRFEVERQETRQRGTGTPITPHKTPDGYILVDWYTTDDKENPQNWSLAKKTLVGLQIFLYTFVVYCASAIYVPSENGVREVFGVGYSKASLGLSLYVIGYGIGPLLFSPLSEVPVFGRNVPYMSSFALFVILCVPLALVENYPGLLVLRFLVGFMGSPCLATGGATMQDMFSLTKLPYALTAWVSASFNGPALGPMISGFVVTAENWRWSLWEVLWMSGPVFILMFICLPETSADNILLRRAKRLRKLTQNSRIRSQSEINQGAQKFRSVLVDSLIKPIEITIKDPAVLFTNVYTSLVYGIYYSFFEVFPLVYPVMYGFNLGESGVVFVCVAVACVLGIVIYLSYIHFYLEPDILKHGLRAQEHRLVPALFAVFFLPIGLFIFGWTANPKIHWIVSVIGITTYSTGAFVLFQCVFMYIPLSYPQYAASLFAGNDAARSLLAAGSIIFARPLYVNLGVGRGISVLGGLSALGVVGLFALYHFGARLRARSKFALA